MIRAPRPVVALLLLVAVATIARLDRFRDLHDRGTFAKYPQLAARLNAGEEIGPRLGDLSPAYFWLHVAAGRAGVGSRAVQIAQIISVSLAALCCGFAAAGSGGFAAMWLATLAVLGSRGAFINATELEPESLLLLLTSASLAMLAMKRGNRSLLIAGLLTGLAATTRPSSLLLLFGAALWLAFSRRSAKSAFSFLGGAAIPIAAVLAVNVWLSGSLALMDPGSVFYEGMNPYATGVGGVQPRVVNDLESVSPEPDSLHVMYRLLAAKAEGRAESRDSANRYWSGKARRWAVDFPLATAELTGRKLLLSLSSYEAWDLSTSWRKERELRSGLWIPFGFLSSFALVALWLARRRSFVLLFGLAFVAALSTMSIFYFSSRQRNALLPAVAILAAIGMSALYDEWERRRAAALGIVAVTLLCGIALSTPTSVTQEDEWNWSSSSLQREILNGAAHSTDPAVRLRLLCDAFLFRPDLWSALPAPALHDRALNALQGSNSPELTFNAAVALQASGDWSRSLVVLQRLRQSGYGPMRESRLPSSISYYVARALLHQGNLAGARRALQEAEREQPGCAESGALAAALSDPASASARREKLSQLHDPFTLRFAEAMALIDAGHAVAAAVELSSLGRTLPQWQRPRALLVTLAH